MIARLLPPEVVAVELFHDPTGALLFAEEQALIANAVPQRRDEFTTARVCARRALAGLGYPPAPILPGPRREPLWPDGVVGSITHCVGYRAAAAAHAADVLTIGIDAEPHQPLPDGVFEWISLPAERSQLQALSAAEPDVHWDRLLFCAKESVYKAWYPITKRWLGVKDADVTVDATGGTSLLISSSKGLRSAA